MHLNGVRVGTPQGPLLKRIRHCFYESPLWGLLEYCVEPVSLEQLVELVLTLENGLYADVSRLPRVATVDALSLSFDVWTPHELYYSAIVDYLQYTLTSLVVNLEFRFPFVFSCYGRRIVKINYNTLTLYLRETSGGSLGGDSRDEAGKELGKKERGGATVAVAGDHLMTKDSLGGVGDTRTGTDAVEVVEGAPARDTTLVKEASLFTNDSLNDSLHDSLNDPLGDSLNDSTEDVGDCAHVSQVPHVEAALSKLQAAILTEYNTLNVMVECSLSASKRAQCRAQLKRAAQLVKSPFRLCVLSPPNLAQR